MKLLNSLYAKIFGWFWLTLVVGGVLVLVLTIFTGAQPLGRRWMRLTQDLYAHSAVDFYTTGGDAALARYLDTLSNSSAMDAHLLDEQRHDVLGRPLSSGLRWLVFRSEQKHGSVFHLGVIWGAATPVDYEGRHFLFVVQAHPMEGFLDGTVAFPMMTRMLLALLIAAGFCVLITRHIVAPVKAMQAGALRLADGDLRARVLSTIAPRRDELADLAGAFDQMAEQMELLIEKRQGMLADISHDLRSPLTRMSVSLELLRRGELDAIPQMEADIDRMNAMIGQILLLTRLDLHPNTMTWEDVDLSGMLRSIVMDAEFEARPQDKTVVLEAGDDAIVRGDANLLRSCFENVVRNAIRYSATHTAVTLRLSRARNLSGFVWGVTVEDHGPGVPEEMLSRLTEPFLRLSESRPHDDSGSGLGLAIAQRIVEVHRGTIRFENLREHTGLRVIIQLPE